MTGAAPSSSPETGAAERLLRGAPRGLAVAITVAVAIAVAVAGVAVLLALLWPDARKEAGSEPPQLPRQQAPLPSSAVAGAPRSDAAAPSSRAPGGAAGARPKLAPEQLARLDEAVLMARLREAASSDPTLTVRLAREGNRRFPDSPDAPERESILIHALSALDRPSEARGQAEFMVNHYPDSAWVREIEAFTGAHRHRNLRLNDAGQIQYE